jgi:hypothetical protein
VWGDGANLKISLVDGGSPGSLQAMRVAVLEKNAQSGNKTGSFYHALQFKEQNWSAADGFRFWITNLSSLPLLLSINFKEEFNEYWATTGNCTYFAISDETHAFQKACEYGNIIIPVNFEGVIFVPFSSFSVPDWNSARGNEILELSRIESFAFGVTLSQDFPNSFDLDDLAVVSNSGQGIFEISGPRSIQVPDEGEHSAKFTSSVLKSGSTDQAYLGVDWYLLETTNPLIRITKDGVLTVPAGVNSQTLPVIATKTDGTNKYSVVFDVAIISSSSGDSASVAADKNLGGSVSGVEEDAYARFSKGFESWAKVNRPLFVILSVASVLLVLVVLSSIQSKLK